MNLGTSFLVAALLGTGLFLFLLNPRQIVVSLPAREAGASSSQAISIIEGPDAASAEFATSTLRQSVSSRLIPDEPPAGQLEDTPAIIKAIYLTRWSAASPQKIVYLEELASTTEINAVVIDLKDFSGELLYPIEASTVRTIQNSHAQPLLRPNALLKELHNHHLYVIGRLAVFQDQVASKVSPDWALKKNSGEFWTDQKGLHWLDPAAEPVWNYNLTIAQDALDRGFDEINFDYIRFPSDGRVENIRYPFWDKRTSRQVVIRNFFAYLRNHLPRARLSADIFGVATVKTDDQGIGQIIEDAYQYFDVVAPMVYPSHFGPGFFGYKNPAAHPYEVVHDSLSSALERLTALNLRTSSTDVSVSSSLASSTFFRAKLRPWLQDFDLGANYTGPMVRAEIQAVSDVFCGFTVGSSSRLRVCDQDETKFGDHFGGWMLWSPTNFYTKSALKTR